MKFKIFFCLLLLLAFSWGQIVSSITPSSAAQGDLGVSVTIFGAGFAATPTVDLGTGITVSSITYLTASLLTANLDISGVAPLGPHDLIVTNPGGSADTLLGAFTVLPETDPPTADMVFPPECDAFISCRDTFIIFNLHDDNGIDDTSLVIRVNGVDYTITDPEVVLLWDSLGYFIPSTWFTDGDTINFSIVQVADTFGNMATMPLTCQFIMDTLPPMVPLTGTEPPMYSSCRDLVPTVTSPVLDDGAGVDSTSIIFTVITPDDDTFHYDIGSPSFRWYHDTLIWEASVAGLSFDLEDTLWVCLHAEDLISDYGCDPNVLDTCWFFYFHVPPPSDVDLILDRIYTDQFPLVTALNLVLDEDARTIEGLDESNFTVWEQYDAGWIQQYPIVVQTLGGAGMVDVVFCIDTTGSMYGMIDDVAAGLHDFAESLAVAGISYRLGLDLFSDYVEFWYGYDLTGDIATFESWIAGLTSGGGGDGPEVSLDAISDALDSMHFRPGATIVIIMVTDASPHTLGDGTSYSDVTTDMVLTNLLAHRAMCFIVADTDWYGVSPEYTTLTEGTGGAFFGWSGPGDFDLILPLISEATRGGYLVSWTSARPTANCQTRDVKIRVDCYDLFDTDEGDYLAPCSPAAAIIEPQPLTWTSDPLQPIIMSFTEIADSINESSIQFMVEGTMYNTFLPELDYTDPYLTWTHTDSFTNRQQVDAELVRLMDNQGNLPYSGPVRWHFWVDLLPPRISDRNPAPNEIVTDHQPQICFKLWDEESGLDVDGVLFAIDCRQSHDNFPPILVTLDQNSPGVTVTGDLFCWDPSVEGYTFWDRDTVCITILRANDSPDYGEPNELPDSLRRWCFLIPDDDTICPDMTELSPDSITTLMPNSPFYIQAKIIDPSGVSHAWVEWDNDGDLDDGTSNIVDMQDIGGDIWQTIEQIPGQIEGANFVYRVWSCDNDIDQGDSTDMSCCATDIMPLHFGLGPAAEIVRPLPLTVTTNKNQEIVMHLYDDTGVDPSTIVLSVAGQNYTVDGVELIYDAVNESLYFYPQPAHYFTDGENVDVELVSADDFTGNHLRGTHQWSFFVDLTPPIVVSSDPAEDEVIFDEQYDVVFVLEDHWRNVDSSSVVLQLFDRTLHYGDAGLVWRSDTLMFLPEMASPEFFFPNGDTVCAKLTCTDNQPDYGEPNQMDTVKVCFVFAVSECDCRPIILTPNGDEKNDKAYFKYPGMVFGKGIIHIFDLEGEEIYKSEKGNSVWDCRSKDGRIVKQGLYIYMIEVEGEALCNGTITVVR